MRKDNTIAIEADNVSLVTLQLFCLDISDIKTPYRKKVHELTTRLIDAWYSHSQRTAASSRRRSTLSMLIKAARALLNTLNPEARQRLAQQLQ